MEDIPQRGTNCLEDFRCPICGNFEHFKIVALSTFTVDQDGTEDPEGCEWDDNSPCICSECDHHGNVRDFLSREAMQDRLVYFEAYACTDNADGPEFAKLLVDQHFCDKLKRLQKLVVDHKLSELRVYDGPDSWGPGDIEDNLRLTCAELVVTSSTFWFTDQPKHADYHIETRSQGIDSFIAAVAQGEGTLFFSDDPKATQDIVEEDETGQCVESPCLEHGHWYFDREQQALYIVPNDEFGEAEIEGPDGDTLERLNEIYRETEFGQVDQETVAEALELEVVPDVLKRFDPDIGYYSA